MSRNEHVTIKGLSEEEGKALAHFIKSNSFNDIRSKAMDDKEAEFICEAIIKLTEGLAFSGYAARF